MKLQLEQHCIEDKIKIKYSLDRLVESMVSICSYGKK
jgi:hypothetical protein